MKIVSDTCLCIEKMKLVGKVAPFTKSGESYYFSKDIEEGTLCLVTNNVRDNGYYEKDTWISNIEVEKDYYPINYCPICGKEITYKKEDVKKMTL